MKTIATTIAIALLATMCIGADGGCDDRHPTSDERQQAQQEQMLQEATSATGMPNIKNFRERKLLKDILELRDQDGLVTYTYLYSEQTGKLVFFGKSIGYGIPYATQYTNPQKVELFGRNDNAAGYSRIAIPQADPNGLFSPSSAEGTWIMLLDPKSGNARPVYVEPRVIVSPFPLATN